MATRTPSPIEEQLARQNPGSATLYERAKKIFPSGVTHDSRYLEPFPLYVTHAQGTHKWDVDGNEYVDYFGGHGALLLGHGHPAVVEAIQRQLPLGTHWGASHELEVRWAELINRLVPCAEMVRFTGSGTEASHLALRIDAGLGYRFIGFADLIDEHLRGASGTVSVRFGMH